MGFGGLFIISHLKIVVNLASNQILYLESSIFHQIRILLWKSYNEQFHQRIYFLCLEEQ